MQSGPVILFDGFCNFCNAGINFIIKQDKRRIFRFAALQSEAGQQLLKQHGLSTKKMESFVLIDKGKVYQKSTAGIKVYGRLPWYWGWTQIAWVAPRFIRDAVYDYIAKKRYQWFGKRDSCMIPTPEIKSRFIG